MFATYSALVALKLKTSSFLNRQQNDSFSEQVQLFILDSSNSTVAIYFLYPFPLRLQPKTSLQTRSTASVADKLITIFRTNVKFIFSPTTLVIVDISILKIHVIEQHISMLWMLQLSFSVYRLGEKYFPPHYVKCWWMG